MKNALFLLLFCSSCSLLNNSAFDKDVQTLETDAKQTVDDAVDAIPDITPSYSTGDVGPQ